MKSSEMANNIHDIPTRKGARRIFVEKREGFQTRAEALREDIQQRLGIELPWLRLISAYDLFGFENELASESMQKIFGETAVDNVSEELPDIPCRILAIEPLPGQFDQRAASAIDCVRLLQPDADVEITSSQILLLPASITEENYGRILNYCLNPVETRIKNLEILEKQKHPEVEGIEVLEGFREIKETDAREFCNQYGLAMNEADLMTAVEYFKTEQRDPTLTEIRILDTYWSDHCRHTTFTTALDQITILPGEVASVLKDLLNLWMDLRKETGRSERQPTLMDLATVAAKALRLRGKTPDVEVSEENNACSVFINVDVEENGEKKQQKWLLQFKNETHNHPTEIEPFGGASTCLGGAIRDPLSGRSYVYQAMRVTGAADPTISVAETLPGKLPQSTISKKAAAGYSSYGNQFGIATTQVKEIYHPGYVAKRMEVGAVVGAVPANQIKRLSPEAGDIVIMLGGATGRDGIGGATGSSKKHDDKSLSTCGSEVQKGNAPEERKIARLFRRSEVTSLIKKSNDFGAGGVSVAIGELADGLDIFLDRVPLKYTGLNATEIAISESQERMAVVIRREDKEKFMELCSEENINSVHVADVTDIARMRLFYKGNVVADLSRKFIDSAGAERHTVAEVASGVDLEKIFHRRPATKEIADNLADCLICNMHDPNVASQKGMQEMFDSSIGCSTVLMPFGGCRQLTESQVSAQTLPHPGASTASVMAWGFNPYLMDQNALLGGAYSCVEALARLAASGSKWGKARFSFQEYFERMSTPQAWGKPLSALLGALAMQMDFEIPAIGGKDSMSGTFNDINVPPTMIAFAVTTADVDNLLSTEFKTPGDNIYLLRHIPLENGMPNTHQLKRHFNLIEELAAEQRINAGYALGFGGLAEALTKMSFGNNLGAEINLPPDEDADDFLFNLSYGTIVVTSSQELEMPELIKLGIVTEKPNLVIKDYESKKSAEVATGDLLAASRRYLKDLYPEKTNISGRVEAAGNGMHAQIQPWPGEKEEHPLVAIPVFPGTNCDYDIRDAFERQGARTEISVFRNQTPGQIEESTTRLAELIDRCHILALSGGFSAGDEPDGSGKFIANVLFNNKVRGAIERLRSRRGLILGICNGFQALVKSGLLPYGKIGELAPDSPTLFTNDINRHISQIVYTRVGTTMSPWLDGFKTGEVHAVAASHGEGKFTCSEEIAEELIKSGQVAFQYCDLAGNPTMNSPENPNGSIMAIEGIISQDGLILGKMAHSERWRPGLMKNIYGNTDQNLFKNAVNYFKTR